MSVMFETANLLAILTIGRNPEWTEQLDGAAAPEYTGAPNRAAAGVALNDTVVAMFCVRLRREVHRRTAYVTVATFDVATTYTVTINGNASTGATGNNLAVLMADLASKVNALAGVTVIADPDDPTDTIKITGDAEADFSITVSTTSGTGALSATADPSSAIARIFVTGAGPNAPGRLPATPASADPGVWAKVPDGVYAVDYGNLLEPLRIAGCERLYVELADIEGHANDGGMIVYTPRVWIGPCAAETDS